MPDDDTRDDDYGISSRDLGYGEGASPLQGGGIGTATTGAGATSGGGVQDGTGIVGDTIPTGTGSGPAAGDFGVASQGGAAGDVRDGDLGTGVNSEPLDEGAGRDAADPSAAAGGTPGTSSSE